LLKKNLNKHALKKRKHQISVNQYFIQVYNLKERRKNDFTFWLLLLHLFFALKSVIYPDKRLLSKQKLSTK